MPIKEEELENGLDIAARYINAYGEKYWPIFERLEKDLETRKSRRLRIMNRLSRAANSGKYD